MSLLRSTAAIATALLLGCFLESCESRTAVVKAASVKSGNERKPAPDFALKDADGKTVRLSDYKGKVVLLDFWATWCGPCKLEIPWFTDMEHARKDKGFEVLGVSMDDNGWEDVKPFLAELKVNYRVVIGDDAVANAYGGVDSLPTTFLIDKQGRIAAIHVGLTGRKEFEDGVDALLQEGNTPVNAGNGGVPPAVAAAKQR